MMVSGAAAAQSHTFEVAAQPAQSGIRAFGQQADAQILISEKTAAAVDTAEVKGTYEVEHGLDVLLSGNRLSWQRTGPNSFSIVERKFREDTVALPEITVQGRREWTLNTGISRSEDDSQPFVVIDGETIRRSGAPNLETFLRNQLSVNASPGTSDQGGAFETRNVSSINLRGLGERETLILVDGRRIAGTTNSDGSLGQPSLSGIPMAAIERIEVLASSASGIYGNGATGGAINIIMRRDYAGSELSSTYNNTFDGGGSGRRFDLTGGRSLQDGRTNITFNASWSTASPIMNRDRSALLLDSKRRGLANNPNYYRFASPLGNTPNIRSTDTRNPLQLDPEYGGATLPSFYTHVPDGYRGLAQDGVNPLIANAGTYQLDLSTTDARDGGQRELIFGTEQQAASIALRHDVTDWLKLYAEASMTRAVSKARRNSIPNDLVLAADAPNNPFAQDVTVTVPFSGGNSVVNENIAQTYRGVFGAIMQLPASWQAVIDVSRSQSRLRNDDFPTEVAQDTLDTFRNGEQDILRDVRLAPNFNYAYENVPYGSRQTPTRNDLTVASLRLAGPIPFKLPGGEPTATVSLERTLQKQAESMNAQNSATQSLVNISAPGREQVDSAYAEINLPLIGSDNKIPLVRELLLTIAGRYERSEETGSPNANCLFIDGPLPSLDIRSLCPPSQPASSARNAHFNPTYSARWRIIDSITLRGSYATGYLTPKLNELLKISNPLLVVSATDPQRGNEQIGLPSPLFPGSYYLTGFSGGNPDARPETSKTFTAGIIVEPTFADGLRMSLDWTRITKRDNYYDPLELLTPDGDPQVQRSFESFLGRYPGRVTRGPASDGYAVGPIETIDASLANLVGSASESYDLAASYSHDLFGGQIGVGLNATYVDSLTQQKVPGGANTNYAGVIGADFLSRLSGIGGLRWKGSGRVEWTGTHLGLSWQARYFDSYHLNETRTVEFSQGAAKIPKQIYHDVSGSYAFADGTTLRLGINNVLNKRPPVDSVSPARYYSTFGDPRLASYYLTLIKSF
ncbi:TonB-dependent receptor domain-containing protein [Xanthomonas arboricola]|uniref:TonB-dependent receptor domain-containing protein n=1 Tax=Xanthomonas arboricola TaxID=56448 RepID=UPI00137B009B|nr:TonB-dependent receptor [Xanthomonas arboricola]